MEGGREALEALIRSVGESVDEHLAHAGEIIEAFEEKGIVKRLDEPGTDADRSISYTYDAVGNRLARAVSVGTRTTDTLYGYDANGELTTDAAAMV